MYNRLILMGRLTRDPKLRTTQNGSVMCRFGIAVDRAYTRQGEEKQTDFFEVVCWANTAEFVSKYFSKGQMILVEGSVQNNHYTDQNGIKHFNVNVIASQVSFCGDKSSRGDGAPQDNWQQNAAHPAADRQQYQQEQPYRDPYYEPYPPSQGRGFHRR